MANSKETLRNRVDDSSLPDTEKLRFEAQIEGVKLSGQGVNVKDSLETLANISQDIDLMEAKIDSQSFFQLPVMSGNNGVRAFNFLRGSRGKSEHKSLNDYRADLQDRLNKGEINSTEVNLRMQEASNQARTVSGQIISELTDGKIDPKEALERARQSGIREVVHKIEKEAPTIVDRSKVINEKDIRAITKMVEADPGFIDLPVYAKKAALDALKVFSDPGAFEYQKQVAKEQVKIAEREERLKKIEMREKQWERTKVWIKRLGKAAAVGALIGVPVALVGVGIAPGAQIASAIAVSMIGGGIVGATARRLTGKGSEIADLDLQIAKTRKERYESKGNVLAAEAGLASVELQRIYAVASLTAEVLANARGLKDEQRGKFVEETVAQITGNQEQLLNYFDNLGTSS